MKAVRYALPVAMLVVGSLPAVAQQDQVMRQSIPYFGSTVTVEVVTPAAGTLRLLRGGRTAEIEVAARGPNAVMGSGVGGLAGDRLRLDAAGTGRVEYLLIVPERIHVRIQLPQQDYALPAPSEPITTYVWPSSVALAYSASPSGVRTGDQLYLVHSSATAPDEVVLEDLAAVRRLAIRTGGSAFELETSRPMAATPGTNRRIAIQAVGEPLDIVITLPEGTQDFALRVPAGLAFAIVGGEAQVNCSPSTSQVLGDGRRWVDLTPVGGVLECTPGMQLPLPVPAGSRGQRGETLK